MFHLDPRVHLHEVEVPVLVHEELHRAHAFIIHAGRGLDGGLAHLLPQRLGHEGTGRLFHEFLVAALDAAIALAHVAVRAVLVACDLDLDVARLQHVLLHVHARITERGTGFLARLFERLLELLFLPHQAHAFATAASRGFQDHRIADLLRLFLRYIEVRHQSFSAGHAGHACGDHGALGRGFVAHGLDLLRQRTNELDAVLLTDAAELGVLAEEAVAGVDGVRVGDLRRSDDPAHVQIAVLAGRRADANGLVGEAYVQAFPVGGAVHGHRLDAHFAGGADHAKGDLAAVGYEDLLEHDSSGIHRNDATTQR